MMDKLNAPDAGEVSNAQVLDKLMAIEALLNRTEPREDSNELWSLKQVAEYFGFSERHIVAVSADPNFPQPVRIPSQRNTRRATNNVRYFVGDIVRYAKRRQRAPR